MTLYINYNTIKSWARESPLIYIYHCEIYLYLFVLFFSILTALIILQCPQFDSCTRETKSTVVKYTEQSARTHVKVNALKRLGKHF